MCMKLIRCEKKSQHIIAMDQDIFNERIHQEAMEAYIADEEDVQEYIAIVSQRLKHLTNCRACPRAPCLL